MHENDVLNQLKYTNIYNNNIMAFHQLITQMEFIKVQLKLKLK